MTLRLFLASVLLAAATITATHAHAAIKHTIDIRAQGLGPALTELAKQTGIQLIYPADLVAGRAAQAVMGSMTPEEALHQLLSQTNLRFIFLDPRTVTLALQNAGDGPDASRPGAGDEIARATQEVLSNLLRLAQAPAAQSETLPNQETAKQERGEGDQSARGSTFPVQLGEVIVTATKREQSVQDIPMSIAVIGNQDIERRGLAAMNDYLNAVPGVTMLDRGAARNAIIFRGISTDPEYEGLFTGSPAVGVYFGDVPLTVTSLDNSADIALVDMERIEVLRGPQGTLYGSGSLSGTVRNLPKSPDLADTEGRLGLSHSVPEGSGNDSYMAQGMLNIPLVADRFAVRAVGYKSQSGGYVDNVAGSDPRSNAIAASVGLPQIAINRSDVGDSEYAGGRLALLWRLNESLDAQFTYLKQRQKQDGFPEIELTRSDKFEQTRFDISGFVSGGERLEVDLDVSNLVLNYEFEKGAILASSAWINFDTVDNHDARQLFAPGTVLGDIPLPQASGQETSAFSQEVRFVSTFGGPFQLIGGIYYEQVDQSRHANTFFGYGDQSLNPFGDPALLLFGLDTDLEQTAFFGEASYSWNDLVTLTVGARAFDYKRDEVDQRGGAFGSGTTPLSIDEKDQSFKASIAYAPSESARLYLQWAQGFRLGRGNLPVPAALCDGNSDGVIDGTGLTLDQILELKSDTLENLELGGKFSWLDNKLTTNIAIYQVDWNDLPLSVVAPCGFGVTPNAGNARVRGVEFEGTWVLNPSLRLNVATSLKDGELTRIVQGVPGQEGDRLPGSADFNFSAGLQYDFSLHQYDAYLRGDYNHVGGYFSNLQEAGVESGNYHLGNVRFGVALKRVNLELFVNNVTNADNLTWTSLAYFADQRGIRLRPRTFGMKLQVDF